jgi:hypothetical protein
MIDLQFPNRKDLLSYRRSFERRLTSLQSGERIFSREADGSGEVNITLNEIVRYKWMIELCIAAITQSDKHLLVAAVSGTVPLHASENLTDINEAEVAN